MREQPLDKDLSWLIFGAGAIGTYIGGSLALHGQRVTFLEQPQVAPELRQHGLCLNLDGEEHRLPSPTIYDSLEEALQASPYDVVIFALKSYDTLSALDGIKPYLSQLPPFLCLQNGVENEAALSAILGTERVIPGTVTSSVGRRAAGDILLEKKRGVGIAGNYPLSTPFLQSLRQSGFDVRLYAKAEEMKWSKMLTNLLANASVAILGMTPAQVLSHPLLYRLEIAQFREALNVMTALKLQVVNLPGVPVRALALAARLLPPRLSQTLIQRGVGGGRGAKMPSFYIDLHSGRGKSEVDYLNGAVVRFGERLGIPTPVNRLLSETLLGMTAGRIPLESYARQPEKLLKMASLVRS